MSVIHNDLLLSTDEATGYKLTKSLRFRSSASASLSRTPASAGNRKTWTFSAWIKRGSLQTTSLFTTYTNTDNSVGVFFSGDTLEVSFYEGSRIGWVVSNAVFRDPAAWYHLVVSIDTTQATSSNRIKAYINGSQLTSLSQAIYPNQNADLLINSTNQHLLGKQNYPGYPHYFDGYMSEVNFIDGQGLTPSSFGETDSITGVWKPKAFAGTYGTNGFYLPFTDVATTSGSNAGLGKDFSGNGNYWTTNNISVTSGSTYDAMTDVPTLTSATAANYAVLNPLNSTSTISYANLQWNSNGNLGSTSSIAPNSGKWYAEFTFSAINSGVVTFGVSNLLTSSAFSGATQTWQLGYSSAGKLENAGSQTTVATYTTGDVLAVAFDCSTGAATFYKNNTSVGTITNAAFANVPVVLGIGAGGGISGTSTGYANFGQQPFTYTPPTGYVALNTYNLPDSTIKAGNKVMDATTYAGNGSTQTITNAGAFKPDLVWIKGRNYAVNNVLNDSVRGISKFLFSDSTSAELTNTGYGVTAFNSNGFTAVDDSAGAYGANGSSKTYVAWQWQAGQGTTSSNTSGSITSTVSVNASAGFSIVTYTGNGSAGATVGHGLGVAPAMMIVKNRSSGTTDSWGVYHQAISSTPANDYLFLNQTAAKGTNIVVWNNTAPTSSVFSIGTDNLVNGNTKSYVAYCWSEIAGFSKAFSYTGNGSSDGPFVHLGFRPKFVIIKRTDTTSNWYINDSSRDTYNVVGQDLAPNLSSAESSDAPVQDFLSNGFKLRNGSYPSFNASGGTYIGMAFAESPFKNSLAR